MIEIRTIPADNGSQKYRRFIDEVLIERAHIFPDFRPLGIAAKDQETSRLLAEQMILDYPAVRILELLPPPEVLELVYMVYAEILGDSRDRRTIGFQMDEALIGRKNLISEITTDVWISLRE
jgi:hypothetical protein